MFVLTIVLMCVLSYLKITYQEYSNGLDEEPAPLKKSYVNRISSEEFNSQKRHFTERKVEELTSSPMFKRKMHELTMLKENYCQSANTTMFN